MTDRQKALEWFKFLRNYMNRSEYGEYLDLAISTLKFKENYDKFWEEVKSAGMRGEEVEIHHSGRVFRIREVLQ